MSICRVISCVVRRGFLLWPACSPGNTVSLCPASFCTLRPNLPVNPNLPWLPTFAFQFPMMKRISFLKILLFYWRLIALQNFVVFCQTSTGISHQFSSVQSLSHVQLFVTPWTAAHQASLSIINSWSLPKPMSIVSVMPSNHLILCHPLLLLPSIFPSIRVFSNESALHIRWPKYWSFSFNISPFNEHPGLISFRMDWLDLLAVQGTLKSLLQHHSSKASISNRYTYILSLLNLPPISLPISPLLVLVLEGLVGHHRTVQLQLLWH